MSVEAGRNSAPASILVVRLGAMGDVIHTLYAVTALRASYPERKIGWAIEERWVELLCAKEPDARRAPNGRRSTVRESSRPVMDFVHKVNTKGWRRSLFAPGTRREFATALREIREQNYDCAVDFQGAIKSAFIARLARAGNIVGLEHPREKPAKMFYERRVPARGVHVIDQYHALAEAVAGTSLPHVAPEFARDEQAEAEVEKRLPHVKHDFVLINPGAGWAAKQWPAKRYGEVAKALAQDGLAAVVNFGPGEEGLASSVHSASGGITLSLSCSIGELIALTRRARLFIGGDTGPLHLAAALKVPVVAIFGPTDPARNGPYGTKNLVLRHPASRTSLSHNNRPDPGLQQITAAEVTAAAHRLLEETRG